MRNLRPWLVGVLLVAVGVCTARAGLAVFPEPTRFAGVWSSPEAGGDTQSTEGAQGATGTTGSTGSTYTIEAVNPSSVYDGAPDTSVQLTGSFPDFTTDGVCVVTGYNTASTPLTATAASGTATVTVPAADFQNIPASAFTNNGSTTANVFIAPNGSNCSTAAAESNIATLTILQYAAYTSPFDAPAGQAGVTLQVTGTLPDFPSQTYAMCFNSGYGAVAPLPVDANGNFNVPASSIQDIPPSAFQSGYFDAETFLVDTSNSSCDATLAISNIYALYLVEPSVNASSITGLTQANPALSNTANPTQLQVMGSDFSNSPLSQVQVTWMNGNSAIGSPITLSGGTYLDQLDLAALVTTPVPGATQLSLAVCNGPDQNYCSAAQTYPISSLATSTGSTTSTQPDPMAASIAASAQFAPAAGSTFSAGAPSGLVNFSDESGTLGSSMLHLVNAAARFLAGDAASVQGSYSTEHSDARGGSGKTVKAPGGSGSAIPPLSARGGTSRSTPTAAGRVFKPRDEPSGIAAGMTPYVTDWNHDGIPDVLLLDTNNAAVHLMLGTAPRGDFVQANDLTPQTGENCNGYTDMAVGDVNGDGYPDIVLLCYADTYSELYVALNVHGEQQPLAAIDLGQFTGTQVSLGDFNGDGKLDILLGGGFNIEFQPSFEVFTGDGTGNFTAIGLFQFPEAAGSNMVAVDLDQDGYTDVATFSTGSSGSPGPAGVTILRNDHTGSFTGGTVTVPGTSSQFYFAPLSTATTYPSLFVTDTEGGTVQVSVNAGSGFGFSGTSLPVAAGHVSGAVFGDVNGDGFTDAVTFDGATLKTYTGDGVGDFAAAFTSAPATASGATLFAAQDVNADGYADVLTLSGDTYSGDVATLQALLTSGPASASISPVAVAPGSHTLTAQTNGTPTLLGSSATFPFTVTGTEYTISAENPASAYTGAAFTLTLQGTLPNFTTDGVCFVTGYGAGTMAGTPLAASASSGNTTVNVPASIMQSIPASAFSSGTLNAQLFIAPLNGTCGATNAESNAVSFAINQYNLSFVLGDGVETNSYPVPAASPGATIPMAGTLPAFPSSTYQVCFNSGYGANAPLNPDGSNNVPVPPTSIQDIPQSAFTANGYATAQLYLVSPNNTSCDPTYSDSNVAAVDVEPPQLRSTSFPALAQVNPALTQTANPLLVQATGFEFLGGSLSQIQFTWAGSGSGSTADATNPTLVNSGSFSLYATLPAVLQGVPPSPPSGSTSVNVAVCNVSGASICSAPISETVVPIGTMSGVAASGTTTPTTTQPVQVTATFTPAATGLGLIEGAPSGPVSFSLDNATPVIEPLQLVTSSASFAASTPAPVNGDDYNPGAGEEAVGTGGRPGAHVKKTARPHDTPLGTYPGQGTPLTPYVTDFNHDGIQDVVLFDPDNYAVHLMLGALPRGQFVQEYDITPQTGCEGSLTDMAVGDLNGDGYPDVAFVCGGAVYFAQNNQQLGLNFAALVGTVTNAAQVAIGDFNADGNKDLVVSGSSSSGAATFSVFLGNGNGTFNTTAITTTGAGFSGNPPLSNLQAQDFNQDGYSDVAVVVGSTTETNAPGLYYLLNDKTGVFTSGGYLGGSPSATFTFAPLSTSLPLPPPSFLISDPANQQVGIAQKTASGNGPFLYVTVPNLQSAAWGDFDGDGNLDAVVYNGSALEVYTGDGNGHLTGPAFSSPSTLSSGLSGSQLFAGEDLNGDGYADALTLSGTTTSGNMGSLTSYMTTGNAMASFNAGTLSAGNHTVSASTNGTITLLGATATLPLAVAPPPAPMLTWATPAAITYGTALSSTQLDAVATDATTGNVVTGTFIYAPAAGSVPATGTDPLSVTFSPTDTTTYSPASKTVQLVVNKANPVLTWPMPVPISYGTALAGTQLDAAATGVAGALAGQFVYTPAAGTELSAGLQTLSVTFTPTDGTDYNAATRTVQIQVNKVSPAVNWPTPAAISYGTPLTSTQLDATSSVAGTFVYTPAAGTVLAAGTHTLSVVFTPTDGTDYAPVTRTVQIAVNQASDGLAWATPAPITYGTALSSAQLDATSSVPGNFVYTPAAGSVLTAGTHTLSVVFTPTDTTDYGTVTQTVQLVVNQATATVTWANPAAMTYGMPLSATQLDATASVPGTFVYTPAAGTVLAAGMHTLSVVFTPTDITDFVTITKTVQFVVNKATAAVSWATPAAITYGTALSPTQLDATSSVPGTFVYTPGAGAVPGAGMQTLSVLFTPTDTADYGPLTQTVTLLVNQATPVVMWPTPAPVNAGTALSATQLDATATGVGGTALPGTFTYTPPAGTVPNPGSQTLSALFSPTDKVDYRNATQTTTLVVNKAQAPVIAWAAPAAITYGTALSAAQLDATSTVPGTFTYTPAAGAVPGAGTQTLSVLFTPTDTVTYTTATRTVTLVVNQAMPVLSWPTPAAIAYGTALSATQLDASAGGVGGASLPGTFAYTPPVNTVPVPGTQTLSVLFTPTDSVDYTTVTRTVALVVNNPTTSGMLGSGLNPSHYGQSVTLTLTLTPSAQTSVMPTGMVTLLDGNTAIRSSSLVNGIASFSVSSLTAGSHSLTAFYEGNATYGASTSQVVTQVVQQTVPVVSWTPSVTSIPYGTALTGAQLDATFVSPYGGAVAAGTPTYTPAPGAVLTAGTQTLSVTLQPQDGLDFAAVTQTVTITVTQAKPAITWPTPANVVVGSMLTSTQLDATETGVSGAALAGSTVYTPPAGSIVQSGPQTLSVSFTPTDTVDYTTATASVILNGTPVTLASVTPATALLGDPAKTISLTGTGFLPTSVVQVNGTAIPTTYLTPTTLSAVAPAADFLNAGTLAVTVNNAVQNQTSAAQSIVVSPPPVPIAFSGPTTPPTSGQQPSASLTLTNPYPVDLTATVTLNFTPLGNGPDDPNVEFPNNTRTLTFTIPANSTITPDIQFQTGTVAGTITLTLNLVAGGVDVTPASVAPIDLVIPQSIPSLTTVTFVQQGTSLSVSVIGFSNTREITQATFHFTGSGDIPLANPDIPVPAGSEFATWFGSPQSLPYGSEFDYTQPFTLSETTPISQVTVTLSNTIGQSQTFTSQVTP